MVLQDPATEAIDHVLIELLRYVEIFGAVAISREGLVVGSAGVSRRDADVIGALGASLAGAAERTARRLGAGIADDLSINTRDGMIHLRTVGDVAVLMFTERCDAHRAGEVCEVAVRQIGEALVAA